MIGVFDSGEGGKSTLDYLRRIYPEENILLLIDRKNAPYGRKNEGELRRIVSENLRILHSFGADIILIGCCTASGVWDRMGIISPDIEVVSIISPTRARAMKMTKEKIALIATEATILSNSFGKEFISLATQELVSIIDRGVSDKSITDAERSIIEGLLSPLSDFGAELLILGCTHFGRLKNTITQIVNGYGIKKVIDSAEVGAQALLRHHSPMKENGITYYLETTKA